MRIDLLIRYLTDWRKAMKEIFLWGSGHIANMALTSAKENGINLIENETFRIKGIIDNNLSKTGGYFHDFRIVSPGEAIDEGFDYISILMENEWDVSIQAKYGYRIEEEKVKDKNFFLKLLLIEKYRNSNDAETIATVDYLKEHDISMFNQHIPERKAVHPVIWDKKLNLPYIEFNDITDMKQRMYFPRNYQFERRDGMQFCSDMNWEQLPTSPHRYTDNNHNIVEGDIIVDGGLCEGNFALKYASIVSKMYLFEPDWWWDEPNYYTFLPFKDKTVYSHKALSNYDSRLCTRIDSIIPNEERIDFIKMDIEGHETDAIEGAEQTFKRNNVKASVCCYHRQDDKKLIERRFSELGYRTRATGGNVVFLWDDDLWHSLSIRKCVIYASK